MFSEIMSAFIEVAEKARGVKPALFSLVKCSRGALSGSIVEKMENWKNTKDKNYFRRREGER